MKPCYRFKKYNMILTRFGCEDCSRLIRSHWATSWATATELRVKNVVYLEFLSKLYRKDCQIVAKISSLERCKSV